MKSYYHATIPENITKIWKEGLSPSADGLVYLAESIEDAVKFKCMISNQLYVLTIRLTKKDEYNLEETFDHSATFFNCRSFGYRGEIPPKKLGQTILWQSENDKIMND